MHKNTELEAKAHSLLIRTLSIRELTTTPTTGTPPSTMVRLIITKLLLLSNRTLTKNQLTISSRITSTLTTTKAKTTTTAMVVISTIVTITRASRTSSMEEIRVGTTTRHLPSQPTSPSQQLLPAHSTWEQMDHHSMISSQRINLRPSLHRQQESRASCPRRPLLQCRASFPAVRSLLHLHLRHLRQLLLSCSSRILSSSLPMFLRPPRSRLNPRKRLLRSLLRPPLARVYLCLLHLR